MKKNAYYHQTKDQILEEEKVIKRAIENPQHFEVLYNKYFLDIYKYVLLRVGEPTVADDVVSRVFVKALNKLPKYKFKGVPYSAWLYRVAYTEIANTFRKRKSEKVVTVPVEEFNHIMHENNMEEILEKEALIKVIKEAIKELNEKQVELLEMRFFEQRSFKEMAEILDITEGNAKVSTHRAIKKVKDILKQLGHA